MREQAWRREDGQPVAGGAFPRILRLPLRARLPGHLVVVT